MDKKKYCQICQSLKRGQSELLKKGENKMDKKEKGMNDKVIDDIAKVVGEYKIDAKLALEILKVVELRQIEYYIEEIFMSL
ncbi:MAG: hypothetical protein PHD70_13630 [Anaerostipes sp.]|nr:hypothetical protein [Anaerostipes sp.]MDD4371277.1 hypothetical protein [Anaerostipes sp.]